MKRFLLVDDNSALRSALRLMLETRLNMLSVLEAGAHAHMIELSMVHQPDYLILDWELSGFNRHNCLDALRDLLPELKIIVISAQPEAASAARADAFVSKIDPPSEVLNAIRRLNGKN